MKLSKRSIKLLLWFQRQKSSALPDAPEECVGQLLAEGFISAVYPPFDLDDERFLERSTSPCGYQITEAGRAYAYGFVRDKSVKTYWISVVSIVLSLAAIVISVLVNYPAIVSTIDTLLH